MNGDEIRVAMHLACKGFADDTRIAKLTDILADLADEVERQEQYHVVNRQSHDIIVDRIEALERTAGIQGVEHD